MPSTPGYSALEKRTGSSKGRREIQILRRSTHAQLSVRGYTSSHTIWRDGVRQGPQQRFFVALRISEVRDRVGKISRFVKGLSSTMSCKRKIFWTSVEMNATHAVACVCRIHFVSCPTGLALRRHHGLCHLARSCTSLSSTLVMLGWVHIPIAKCTI